MDVFVRELGVVQCQPHLESHLLQSGVDGTQKYSQVVAQAGFSLHNVAACFRNVLSLVPMRLDSNWLVAS